VQANDQPAQALGTPEPAAKGKGSETGGNGWCLAACNIKH